MPAGAPPPQLCISVGVTHLPCLPPCPSGSCVSCLTCHRKPETGSSPTEFSRGWGMALDREWQRQACLGVMWIDRPSLGFPEEAAGGTATGWGSLCLNRETLGPRWPARLGDGGSSQPHLHSHQVRPFLGLACARHGTQW